MFTGIIEATAKILSQGKGKLTVARPSFFTDIKEGSSIAVSGVCLTVIKLTRKAMTFDVVQETLKKTTLGSKEEGDCVNLERAMKAGGRLDGHVVQGHVDGVGVVKDIRRRMSDVRVTIELPSSLITNVIQKGSITLDGVSLTIAAISGSDVSVALIPTTLQETTLGLLRKGDRVNIETDILGRYVRRFLSPST